MMSKAIYHPRNRMIILWSTMAGYVRKTCSSSLNKFLQRYLMDSVDRSLAILSPPVLLLSLFNNLSSSATQYHLTKLNKSYGYVSNHRLISMIKNLPGRFVFILDIFSLLRLLSFNHSHFHLFLLFRQTNGLSLSFFSMKNRILVKILSF